MNFPMDTPLFQFLYWLVDTAGLGGIAVALIGGGSILTYALFLRKIALSREDGDEQYSYPTPTLFHGAERHE